MTDYAIYDDQALLGAINDPQEGARAFTALYQRHAPALYENILLFVKDPLEAEEAVQEIFARLWQKRGHLEITGNVAAYLNRACRNLVYDSFRKIKKDRDLLERLKEVAGSELSELSGAEQEDLVQRQWALLQRAMENLPPVRRKAFELCKVKGYTYKQACEELGIQLPTLKDHMLKAQRSIRSFLGEQGDEIAVTLLVLLDLMEKN